VKARLCLLIVILGLAGVAAPTSLAGFIAPTALAGDVGDPIGYHDGDQAPVAGEEVLVEER
jgi:hypothetical protein